MFRRRKFEIETHGLYPRDKVIVHDSAEHMMMTPKLRDLIEEEWQKKEARMVKREGLFFSGDLCRLNRYEVRENELHLFLGRTHFKELLGTNLSHPIIHKLLGEEYMSNGLGVRAAICTHDEKIIICQRSEKVMEAAGYYHLCGGYVKPSKHHRRGIPDPYLSMESYMEEELGISKESIRRLVCSGLAVNSETLKPELMFEAEIDLTFRKVLVNMAKAARDFTHSELFGIMAQKTSLRGFLVANKRKIAPTGQACLWIYGIEKGYWPEVRKGILKRYAERKLRRKADENRGRS
ncbi:MAG: hypothetical protein JSV84_01675 [Gemmatimonadota bacterium]|nr:MAG: hypothetical protein JSV84_01675 [Gemmatimonadota bacterium]